MYDFVHFRRSLYSERYTAKWRSPFATSYGVAICTNRKPTHGFKYFSSPCSCAKHTLPVKQRQYKSDAIKGNLSFIFIAVRWSNEPCGVNDTCIDSMACINGTCQCAYDQSRIVDTGFDTFGQYCVQPTDRFLGKACTPTIHSCYQLSSKTSLLCVGHAALISSPSSL